jgi:glutaconate CoA-transferase subunit B
VTDCTRGELLAVVAAQEVRNDDVVVVGLGLPQIGALLATRTHAPDAVLLLEIGVFEPDPRSPSMGIADPRMWEGCASFGSMLDVLGCMLHGGRVTLGMLGALQVDGDGSINSTAVRHEDGSERRLNGSGGANDIASMAGRTLAIIQHQPRKFRAAVDFVTSPGRRIRGRPRAELGLPGRGTTTIITDRAVLDVGEQGLVLRSFHPGESAEGIVADTPVPLSFPEGGPVETPAPSSDQIRLIRAELDPHGWYTR